MNLFVDKKCKICNDRAFCFNFGVVTCESCKSFFRRNGHLTAEDFRCPFDENCDINYMNRKTCKRCRLLKCLKAGMHIDKSKVYIYKSKSSRSENESRPISVYLDNDLFSVQSPTASSFSNSIYSPILDEVNAETNQVDNFLSQMTPIDQELIQELWSASSVLLADEDYVNRLDRQGLLPNEHRPLDKMIAVNLMENAHQKLIEMCKLIDFFTLLNENDQISLLKGSLAEMFFILELSSYDRGNSIFKLWPFQPEINGFFTFENLRELTPASYDLAMRYLSTFDPLWQRDRTLILLMEAICLFTPRIFNHQFRELAKINQYRQCYEKSLKNYFKQQYSCPIKAAVQTEALLAKISELQQLQEMPAQKTIKIASDMLLPLLSELFANKIESTTQTTTEVVDYQLVQQETACAF